MLKYKVAILLSFTLLLGGCGESSIANLRIVYKDLITKNVDAVLKRKAINDIPYATISANFKSQDPSILVLGYIDLGNMLQWVSSNDVSIITQNGRIVKTVGFEEDLVDTSFVGEDPLAKDAHLIAKPLAYERIVRFGGDDPWQGNLQCEVVSEGPERITIIELDFETIRLTERCKGVKWWIVKNTFWVDAYDGMVWKSYQTLFVEEPRMEISTLKPLG